MQELWPENEETVILDGLVTEEALRGIVEYARRDKNSKPTRGEMLTTTKLLDYVTLWEAEWVSKFSDTVLKELLKACHALHYDAPKYVCLYHIMLRG